MKLKAENENEANELIQFSEIARGNKNDLA